MTSIADGNLGHRVATADSLLAEKEEDAGGCGREMRSGGGSAVCGRPGAQAATLPLGEQSQSEAATAAARFSLHSLDAGGRKQEAADDARRRAVMPPHRPPLLSTARVVLVWERDKPLRHGAYQWQGRLG
ncbi:hypothetical protein OsI_22793 [Oryza sativa Indica Group]|uniref:Uncharacterized protein n=1 Tax=Oryza sativa subsp. indica TaxID=39946 RepID=A2YCF6_ORYSI|nr:hypothetical protein OsI_22793 [Oryza sativa Indica Group]